MWWSAIGIAFAAYLLLVRCLRYRQRDRFLEQFTSSELQRMTPATAQKIALNSLHYDNVVTMTLGTYVALFKVFGIVRCPAVSSSPYTLTLLLCCAAKCSLPTHQDRHF